MKKICRACGTQFPENYHLALCAICSEERQFIPIYGQRWTTHQELVESYKTEITEINEYLYEIIITPKFGIGQRAFLVLSESGNILWDCIPLLDQNIINFINQKGGLKAIAISHPHYYSNMNDWAEEFNCSVYIHSFDKEYVADKGRSVHHWSGESFKLWDNITIENIGGHFKGSSVLIISKLSKLGVMLCGDTMYLSPSMNFFAIMHSYPNRIPLKRTEILRIKERLSNLSFDTIYGFYSYQNLTENVREIVAKSIEQHLSE